DRDGRLWSFAAARVRARRCDARHPAIDDNSGADVALVHIPESESGFPIKTCATESTAIRLASVPFEILHRALVAFGSSARLEGAEIAPLAGLRIDLARVQPVLAAFEFSDHRFLPAGKRRKPPLVAD